MTFVPVAEDFHVEWDADHTFTFFESENGEFFAFGHRNPSEFIEEVNEYFKVCLGDIYDPEDYAVSPENIRHTWAVVNHGESVDDEWTFRYGDEYKGEENAFPLTYIYN